MQRQQRLVVILMALAACGNKPPLPAPPRPPAEGAVVESDEESFDPCADVDAQREAFITAHQDDVHEGPGAEDHAYPPDCKLLSVARSDELPDRWTDAVGWCQVDDEIYGPKQCTVRFQDGHASAAVELSAESANAEISVSISARDLFPGGDLEAIVRFRLEHEERIAICRALPTLACTPLFLVAEETWRARETFRKGALVLEQDIGAAPAEAIGAHPMIFDSPAPSTAPPR
jgi:predicted small lipoprotein YifL